MIPASENSKLNGSEPFTNNGEPIGNNTLSFWQWSSSELLGNTLRGVLAEYIVSLDLQCVSRTRKEWDSYDLTTPDGITIEVKSASYLQSWDQTAHSKLSFSIAPTVGWDETTGKTDDQARRQAQYYIFCVLAHKEMATVNPLALEQWEYYVLPTSVLNALSLTQKSITIGSLLKLGPTQCAFGQIDRTLKALQADQ